MPAGSLWKLLQNSQPQLIGQVMLKRLTAPKAFVDAANLVDKALTATRFLGRQRGFVRQPRTTDGLRCAFLRPLLGIASELHKGGIEPVIVVDAEPYLQRQILRSDPLQLPPRKRGGVRRGELELVRTFFSLCGVEVVGCEGNGEKVLAYLSRKARAPVLSENGELLGLGVAALVRNVRLSKDASVMHMDKVLKALQLKAEALPVLQVLLGTANNLRLPRVAATRLIDLLREGSKLEQILTLYSLADPDLTSMQRVEEYFACRQKPLFKKTRRRTPDSSALTAFLQTRLRPGKLRFALEMRLNSFASAAPAPYK